MTSTTMMQLGLTHIGANSLWILVAKATIILVAAIGVTLAMQRASAGARHLVWLVTLGSLLLVPIVGAWAPLRIALLPAAEQSATAAQPAAASPSYGAALNARHGNIAAFAGSIVATPSSPTAPAPTARVSAWRRADPLTVLLLVWAVVAFAILASLAGATLALRRIVRAGHPVTDESWLATLWDICDRLGLDKAPILLRSEETQMPFACGVFNPTVVLPADCDSWTLDRRRAVLLHELAHVARHDLLGHTLGRLVSAAYWFHPLVWTAAKHLRAESERACDDLALSCGTVAADYAEHLLDIVTSVRRERTPAVALAMARRKEFEGRMLAILDPEIARAKLARWKLVTLVASLGVLSVLVGAVSPTARSAALIVQPTSTQRAAAPTKRSAVEPAGADVSALSASARPVATPTKAEQTSAAVSAVTLNRSTQSTIRPIAGALMQELGLPPRDAATKSQQGSPDDRAAVLERVLRTDTSASIRKVAAWGLAQYLDAPGVGPALSTALGHDADPVVREMAAWALSRSDESPVVSSALTTALRHDADAKVRAASAWSLGTIGSATALDALTEALADPSPDVVTRSVWAIGRVQPEHAPRALTAKLSDRDSQVRTVAAWALFRIGDPATVPALEAAVQAEQNKDVQVADIRAIAKVGSDSGGSIAILQKLINSPDERVRAVAINAIAGAHGTGPWPWPWPWPRPYP